MAATIAALLLAALLVSCDGEVVIPGGSAHPTLPPPIASDPPRRPSPTLEVPPPIN